MRRPAPAINRAKPLRHDPLATELASLAKHNRAVFLEMLIKDDAQVRAGEARRQIVSGACNQPHAGTIAPGQNAEPVMLDFVEPFRPRWRPLGAGREAGRNMADRTAGPRFYDGVRGQSGPGPLARPGLCCLIARTCQFGNPTLGPTTLFGVSVGH